MKTRAACSVRRTEGHILLLNRNMKFIRLTTMLIHPSSIKYVTIQPNHYTIHFQHHTVSGMILAGSGIVSSGNDIIHISKEKNLTDFEAMRKWIEQV